MKMMRWLPVVAFTVLLLLLAGCAMPVQQTQPAAEEGAGHHDVHDP